MLSAGTAICFGLNASGVNFQNVNGALFALTTLGWPVLYYTVVKHTPDTNYGKEDSVVVPVHLRQELGLVETGNEDLKVALGEAEIPIKETSDSKVSRVAE